MPLPKPDISNAKVGEVAVEELVWIGIHCVCIIETLRALLNFVVDSDTPAHASIVYYSSTKSRVMYCWLTKFNMNTVFSGV